MEGTVKWFDDVKGFGFIEGDDGRDYFVHYSVLEREGERRRTLKEGDDVTFQPTTTPKGPAAINVRVLRP